VAMLDFQLLKAPEHHYLPAIGVRKKRHGSP